MHSLLHTASLQISYVLKRLGTYANESGSVHAALLHISCVLRRSGIVIIQLVMFIYALKGQLRVKSPASYTDQGYGTAPTISSYIFCVLK